MTILELYFEQLSVSEINKRRKRIYNAIKNKNIFKVDTLLLIFGLLHNINFSYILSKNITFFYNNRLNTSSSILKIYLCNDNYQYELHVSKKIFTNILSKKNIYCNGICCKNIFTALIITLEHEYVHYLIAMY